MSRRPSPARTVLGVKKYVAVVRGARGNLFRVFTTGDDKYLLFQPVDARGIAYDLPAFPVLRSRLRDDVRRALANGWGHAL